MFVGFLRVPRCEKGEGRKPGEEPYGILGESPTPRNRILLYQHRRGKKHTEKCGVLRHFLLDPKPHPGLFRSEVNFLAPIEIKRLNHHFCPAPLEGDIFRFEILPPQKKKSGTFIAKPVFFSPPQKHTNKNNTKTRFLCIFFWHFLSLKMRASSLEPGGDHFFVPAELPRRTSWWFQPL